MPNPVAALSDQVDSAYPEQCQTTGVRMTAAGAGTYLVIQQNPARETLCIARLPGCSDCYVRQHPGSMQCPWRWCLRWYISHGGSAYLKECLYHSTGACKTMTYDDYLKRNRKTACVS